MKHALNMPKIDLFVMDVNLNNVNYAKLTHITKVLLANLINNILIVKNVNIVIYQIVKIKIVN